MKKVKTRKQNIAKPWKCSRMQYINGFKRANQITEHQPSGQSTSAPLYWLLDVDLVLDIVLYALDKLLTSLWSWKSNKLSQEGHGGLQLIYCSQKKIQDAMITKNQNDIKSRFHLNFIITLVFLKQEQM